MDFKKYFKNNPGLRPIQQQHWYNGFVQDMLNRGYRDSEIQEMLFPKPKVVENRNPCVRKTGRTVEGEAQSQAEVLS